MAVVRAVGSDMGSPPYGLRTDVLGLSLFMVGGATEVSIVF